jgi:phosphonate transport system permease protein
MIAYTVYRFECGLRAAAVLGWFGIPTVGEKIMRSDENLFYGEVWLYLYTLIALIGAVEWWSSTLRRRLVG